MKKKWFIGVDVGKSNLDICIYDGKKKPDNENSLRISNHSVGFKEFTGWLKEKKITPSQTLVCMEHTGIYSLDFCFYLEKVNMDYSMLNPVHLKRSLGLIRGKNDKVDAHRIASYSYLHREDLKPSKLSSHLSKTKRINVRVQTL